jgi:hypothetical protein
VATDVDTTLSWLTALPSALRGDAVVHVVEPDTGKVVVGGDDGTTFVADAGGVPRPIAAPGRRVMTASVAGRQVVLSLAEGDATTAVADLWRTLTGAFEERDQLTRDLEAMYPSSLALLEEAAMWGDVLPTLPTGKTEEDIAEIGVRALVVAASVERALYVRWRPEVEQGEVLVHVAMDRSGSHARTVAAPEPRVFVPGDGLVGRALRGSGGAVLSKVAELKALDGPERLALKELIAVPVRYGVGDNTQTLGVLLVMDKYANSYAAHEDLSSHETKLAHAVAAMLGSVLGTRRVVELGKELETAREIHDQIQAGGAVSVPGFDVAGSNRACGTVGGDYFDFLPLADGRTLAAVMDVSGHNLASGMLMVSARMSLRLLADLHDSPAKVVTELARAMHSDLNRTERFISAVAVALEPGSRRVEVVNAGHLDTLVLRAATGAIEAVPSDDVVLGFTPGVQFSGRALELQPGDVVLLYTDGVIETTDAGEDMFGSERLEQILRASALLSAKDVVAAIVQAVDKFRGSQRRMDDVTVLAIKVSAQESPS